MFRIPASLKRPAIALLASLVVVTAAQADHFKFVVAFLDGALTGTTHTGYFKTDAACGNFKPDQAPGDRMLSLAITIDGDLFTMQDDVDFPGMPMARVKCDGYTSWFDYYTNATGAPHNKALSMVRRDLAYDMIENTVTMYRWVQGERILYSTGVIFDIIPISAREAPPEPECLPCHSSMQVPDRAFRAK